MEIKLSVKSDWDGNGKKVSNVYINDVFKQQISGHGAVYYNLDYSLGMFGPTGFQTITTDNIDNVIVCLEPIGENILIKVLERQQLIGAFYWSRENEKNMQDK